MLVERTPRQTPPRAALSPRAVTRRIAPERKIQIVGTSHSTVSDELEHARRAWIRYQSTRKRAAVYGYLNAVFEISQRWIKQGRAKTYSLQALATTKHPSAIRIDEPFAAVIFCTSDPEIADAKTRSKWSRVLRCARKTKPSNQRLTDFIKSKGGVNACARRFAKASRLAILLGRLASPVTSRCTRSMCISSGPLLSGAARVGGISRIFYRCRPKTCWPMPNGKG